MLVTHGSERVIGPHVIQFRGNRACNFKSEITRPITP